MNIFDLVSMHTTVQQVDDQLEACALVLRDINQGAATDCSTKLSLSLEIGLLRARKCQILGIDPRVYNYRGDPAGK